MLEGLVLVAAMAEGVKRAEQQQQRPGLDGSQLTGGGTTDASGASAGFEVGGVGDVALSHAAQAPLRPAALANGQIATGCTDLRHF